MKFHFIGIGGTGMGALAGLLKEAGHDVRGSDSALYPPMSDQLAALGVPVFDGFRAENLDWSPDQVVVGNVCTKDHVEVLAAGSRRLPLTSFPAVLEEEFLKDRHSIVVAGTHGKTTTSSLMAHVMVDAGRDPSFLVGGVPHNFGRGWRLGKGEEFVIEGDEYDSAFFDKGSKFLHYRPRTCILTSVELDHVDIFDSMEDVRATFRKLIALVPQDGLLLVAASSAEAVALAREADARVETYAVAGRVAAGTARPPTWLAEPVDGPQAERSRFRVLRHPGEQAGSGEYVGTFEVGLTGGYNVENALAVVAAAISRGVEVNAIVRALHRFRGVKRRQEIRGVAAGVTVIDDYAHHPTAVRETLAAVRKRCPRGRIVAVYEPRSATSRRATFQHEYVDAFAGADDVVVGALFAPDKIPRAERFDPERLVADLRGRGVGGRVIPDVAAIVRHVADEVKPGDCVAIFSSGAFGGIHRKLLEELGDPITPAAVEEMARVREILQITGLSCSDATDERVSEYLVVSDESGVVGCVAIEQHDDTGILRSLAVIPERRGRGLGWLLADTAVGVARASGVRRLYLLTETASDFFAEKIGFQVIERAVVDPQVQESRHFRECAATAVAMGLDL